MYRTESGRSECLRNENGDFVGMAAVTIHYWKDEPERWKPFVRQYRYAKKKGTTAHKCWHGLTNLEGIQAIATCFSDAKTAKRNRLDPWKEAVRKDHSIIPSHSTTRWIDVQGKVLLAKAIARGSKVNETGPCLARPSRRPSRGPRGYPACVGGTGVLPVPGLLFAFCVGVARAWAGCGVDVPE